MTDSPFPVVWEPSELVTLPSLVQEFPSFPAIPSAYYPKSINDVGTPEQIANSAQIWYSLLVDEVFPLETVYAKARPDQIGYSAPLRPDSEISLSLKKKLRQYPDSVSWINNPSLNLFLGGIPYLDAANVFADINRFPCDPSVSFFEAVRLIRDYLNTGDDSLILQHFRNNQRNNLIPTLNYYPPYELLFLMTRFASRPLSQHQLELILIRKETSFNSAAQIFIDQVFYQPDQTKYADILNLAERLLVSSPEEVGVLMGTPFGDWVNWASEYLLLIESPILEVPYAGAGLGLLEDQYVTWPDSYLVELAQELKFELPARAEFIGRKDWIRTIAAIAQRKVTSQA